MASAVSANRCISSFSLHQNLETFAHASRKNESFDPDQTLHGCGIAGRGELLHLVQNSEADEVVHLLREENGVERSTASLLHQIRKVHVRGNVLLADSDVR